MWLRFVIFGLVIAGALWAMSKRSLPKALRILLGTMLPFFFVVAWYLISDQMFLGDGVWYQGTPAKELILFLFMICGMISRYMTIIIEDRRKKIKSQSDELKKKPGIEFDVWDFSYPLFVSVITFGVLLQQVGSESLNLSNVIMSFQTGFFWQTILSKAGPQ